jgi:hypothetical protein
MLGKISMVLVVSLFAAAIATSALAADPTTHEGMVVSASAGRLTMKDKAGKEHTHAVGAEAKVTVHGKPARLEDLKPGMPIRVTTEGDKVLAVATIDDMK